MEALIAGVNDISDFEYNAIPAGFVLKVETSAPNAPKAPPKAIYLAVPPNVIREYLRASISFWAFNVRVNKVIINIKPIFFIIIFFNSFLSF